MIRAVSSTALALAAMAVLSAPVLSTPARAATLSVPVAGLTPQQVHDQVLAAADKVCSEAMHRHELDDADSEDQCVADTVDAAMKKIASGGDIQLAAISHK